MAIRFRCPHCKKPLSVKDQLAGKKAACPACKKVLTIPTPVSALIDVEELAAAALTDEPAAPTPQAETKKINFTCPFCDATVEVGADLAGKQAPCPDCRRIIKVPQLVKNEPKDWRQAPRGPSAARQTVEPPPEGAWGSAATSRASQQALAEAGVLVEEREPWTLKQKIVLSSAAAAVVILVAFVWWAWSYFSSAARQQRALSLALQGVSSDSNKFKLSWDRDAAIHLAAGEWYLRTGQRDCAEKAHESFSRARAFLRSSNSGDRDLLLTELALAEVDLGGEGDEVDKGRRLTWDKTQRELEQTLQSINSPDLRIEAFRAVCRRLVARGQGHRLGPMARKASSPPLTAEMMAVAGLELFRAKNQPGAESLAQDALGLQRTAAAVPAREKEPPRPDAALKDPKGAGNEPEVQSLPLSLAALLVALNRESEVPGLPRRDRIALMGLAEGRALRGDLSAAREAAKLLFPIDQLRALVGIADITLDSTPPDTTDLDAALSLVEGERSPLRGGAAPPVLLLRLIQLGLRAKQTERMEGLVRTLQAPDVRAWAQLVVLRAKLAGMEERADDALANAIDKNRLAHALALEAIARHNARHDGKPPTVIAAWDEKLQPFGYIGAALGIQDRDTVTR